MHFLKLFYEIKLSDQENLVTNDQTISCKLHTNRISEKKQGLTVEIIVNTIWISTFLALILTIPSLIIFMATYFSTGNILLGVVLGFGLHFVGLAYSERISEGLLRMMS